MQQATNRFRLKIIWLPIDLNQSEKGEWPSCYINLTSEPLTITSLVFHGIGGLSHGTGIMIIIILPWYSAVLINWCPAKK